MSAVVLDASAVLALLQQEPGAEMVSKIMGKAIISSVNWLEVASKLGRTTPLEDVLAILEEIQLTVVPFDEAQAVQAFSIEATILPLKISLGDRSCLGLARSRNLPVVTADKIWQKLNIGVEVKLIR
jgi:PIN domain nuclease of toxin-antitoxin system